MVSTMTVTTTPQSAFLRKGPGLWFPGSLLAAVLCFFGAKKRRSFRTLLLTVSILGLAALVGCGASVTPPLSKTATVTVTGTSGSLQHTATFSLTVQGQVVASATPALHSKSGPWLPFVSMGVAVWTFAKRKWSGTRLTMMVIGIVSTCMLAGCNGVTYKSSSGSGSQSSAPTITTQPANQAVTVGQTATFTVAATGTGTLTYQWSKNGTTITGATAASYTAPAASASDSGSGFTVVVSNANGSVISNTAILTVTGGTSSACTTAPSTPAGLAATATSATQVGVSWNASTAGTGCTITYNVYRSTTSGFTPAAGNQVATGITGTTFADSGLAASTTYYYVVVAVDAAGASAPSAQASATTQSAGTTQTDIVAIAAGGPAQSNATGGDASFVADEYYSGGGINGAVTTAINLTQPGANAAPMGVYQNGRVGVSTYTVPGLAPGAQYTVLLHFAETYFTAAGSREFNVAINGTTVLTNLDVYASVGTNAAMVESFTANANSSGQIAIAFTDGAANQPLIMGIEIRGASSACTLLPSSAPTGLTALASSPSIIGLTWSGVNPPPNCAITYSVYGSTTSGFTPSASNLIASGLTSATYSNTGLTASTTYYYVVEAVDADGASGPSTQASAETNSANSCISVPSSAPAGLTATATLSSAVSLSWSPITAPANCTNITYNLYGSTTSGFTPAPTNEIAVGLTGTAFVNNALPPSTTYYYSVQAADEDGPSTAVSSQVTATTLAPETTLTAAMVSANEIDLSWPPSAAPAPVTYTINRSSTPSFTPSISNQIGTNKANFFQDVLASADTKYYYMIQGASSDPVMGPVSATTMALGSDAPFWDASNMPPTAQGNALVFKFLNRTNGQYTDDQITWSATIAGATTTSTIAQNPTFQMPANASGRMYFYLGTVGQNSNDYYDFIEYTIGPNGNGNGYFFNGDTTRVDAFGVKLAFNLTCSDPLNIAVGENAAAFAENRSTTFQRYLDAVPSEFQQEAQVPYRIVEPGAGGFNAGGPYQDYYDPWATQLWQANGFNTADVPLPEANGNGIAQPSLSGAFYRHVGAVAGTFDPDTGVLDNSGLWGNPSAFYQSDPTDHYAKFMHSIAINGQQYAFPYDDSGGYSSDVSCNNAQTLLVAIGW